MRRLTKRDQYSGVMVLRMKAGNKGFTIIELLVVVAVVAISLTIALPSFQAFVLNGRISTETNNLVSALNIARSEAVKRGARVSISAVGGNWNNGWEVKVVSSNEKILVMEAPADSIVITPSGGAQYEYLPSGSVNQNTEQSFYFCDNVRSGEEGRQVTLSIMGRASTTTYTCS
jgi:type IV fimbrial biogenesis protein FimT